MSTVDFESQTLKCQSVGVGSRNKTSQLHESQTLKYHTEPLVQGFYHTEPLVQGFYHRTPHIFCGNIYTQQSIQSNHS